MNSLTGNEHIRCIEIGKGKVVVVRKPWATNTLDVLKFGHGSFGNFPYLRATNTLDVLKSTWANWSATGDWGQRTH